MAPAAMYSWPVRAPSVECPWLPIWVTILGFAFALSASMRHSRTDQHSGRQLPLALELLQPELHALERFLAIAGVEQHQRGGDIFQKDGVDLPVDRLPGQIPQHRFLMQRNAARRLHNIAFENMRLARMR